MSQPSTSSEPPPKATLICPDCDHTSPPTGDWERYHRFTKTIYRCPRCRTQVVSRPLERRKLVRTPLAAVPGMVTAFWQGYLRVVGRFLR